MSRLYSLVLTTVVLLWSIFCCSFALVVALISKKAIPWVLKGIGSNLWSKYIMVFTGNSRMSITHHSKVSIPSELPSRAIFVSNHVSQLDINAASYAIPHPIVFLAKDSIRKVPILGLLNERVGTVFINRSNKEAAQKAVFQLRKTLDLGISVLVFPEGTRSIDGAIKPFKKGAFHLALQANVPIVPMHIHGTRRALPSKSIWVKANPIHVRFGDPIYPKDHGDNVKSMNDVAKASIEALQLWHRAQISSPD